MGPAFLAPLRVRSVMSLTIDVLGRLWAGLTTPGDPRVELARMRSLSRFLDSAVRIPGTQRRIGADAIVGLLPVAGDAAGALVSLYILYRAVLLGVPVRTLVRMCVNLLVDVAVGSIPVVGDVFDVTWKANERNVDLVERFLDSA